MSLRTIECVSREGTAATTDPHRATRICAENVFGKDKDGTPFQPTLELRQ